MNNILISSCLLGENVRYDGGNCLIAYSDLKQLKANYHLVSICPELLAGLGVPRLPIEIHKNDIINQKGEKLTNLFCPVKKQVESRGK